MASNPISIAVDEVKEVFHDSIHRSKELEEYLLGLPDEIVRYENEAEDFVDSNIASLSSKINLAYIQEQLNKVDIYNKVKDKDISVPIGFFQSPETIDGDDIAPLIHWVDDFLQPFGLENQEAFVDLALDFTEHLLTILENTNTESGSIITTIQQFKSDDIKSDMNRLTSLVNAEGSFMHEKIEDIESFIAEMEDKIEALEQTFQLDAVLDTLSNYAHPFIPDGFPITADHLKTAFDEVKKIDLSQPREMIVRDIVHRIAEISDTHTISHPDFASINGIIQKLSSIICFIIDHRLLETIKIKKLALGESLIPPQNKPVMPKPLAYQGAVKVVTTNGTSTTPALAANQNQDVKVAGKDTKTVAVETPIAVQEISSAQTTTPSNVDIFAELERLVEDGIYQLVGHTGDFAQELLDGTAFQEIQDSFEDFILNLEDSALEAIGGYRTFLESKPMSLNQAVERFIQELVNLKETFFNEIDALIKQMIGLLSKFAHFLVDLFLALKLPGKPDDYPPGLSGVVEVNLPCLLVAIPWEVVRKIQKPIQLEIHN